MLDTQIKNPSCRKCHREWTKTTPLVMLMGEYFCGDCLLLIKEKMKKYLIE